MLKGGGTSAFQVGHAVYMTSVEVEMEVKHGVNSDAEPGLQLLHHST